MILLHAGAHVPMQACVRSYARTLAMHAYNVHGCRYADVHHLLRASVGVCQFVCIYARRMGLKEHEQGDRVLESEQVRAKER